MNRSISIATFLIILVVFTSLGTANYLLSQVRADTAQSIRDLKYLDSKIQLRHLDTGLWLIDGNDASGGEECTFPGGVHFWGKRCSQSVTLCSGIGDNFFNGQIWALLTTPIAYIDDIPVDPFGDEMFYGYEDRDCANRPASPHWLMFGAGPDRDHGDWIDRTATPYNVTNGLTSNGDIWRLHIFRETFFNTEFIGVRVVKF